MSAGENVRKYSNSLEVLLVFRFLITCCYPNLNKNLCRYIPTAPLAMAMPAKLPATFTSTYAISNAAVSVLISFRLGLKMLLNYAVDFLGTKQNQIFLNTNFQ